jgi:hypothetical protein
MPPDDPKQTEGTVSGLGPATRPGIPQGYSVTSVSTPPSAPLYNQQRFDPAEIPPPSRPMSSLDELARRAGKK